MLTLSTWRNDRMYSTAPPMSFQSDAIVVSAWG